MRYAIEYNLCEHSVENKKACLGTICHKVYELLALRKFCSQTGQDLIEDDLLGSIGPEECELLSLLDRVFEVEINKGIHHFTKGDKKNVLTWLENVLQFNDGAYNPAKLIIVAPEKKFDIELKYDWAKYSFDLSGKHYEGYARLRGTADLLIDTGIKGVYQLIDLKTGVRVDWTKADTPVKTSEYLLNDHQMMMYYFAMRHLYPDLDDLLMTLFYTKDGEIGGFRGVPKRTISGGPMHINFSTDDLPKIENMLKDTFKKIIDIEIPKLNKTWACTSLCYFGKNPARQDPNQTICEFYHKEINDKGLIKVIEEHGNLSRFGNYTSGGGRSYKENGEKE